MSTTSIVVVPSRVDGAVKVAPLSPAEFWALVASRLGGIHIELELSEQEEFDALGRYGAIRALEYLGVPVPDQLRPYLLTPGDIYHHYVTRTTTK